MTTSPEIVSPYTRRVTLVADAIKAHSKLKGDAADELAVQVLHALNSIPETMR
ncbi:hypothetical protein H7J88_01635 [Mycolicibacterium flavescens]|uniref:DUF6307 family protein n=1 Tax=Mycolicibacterium flavescens TaxID=1776 RepID=UPI000A96682F|nr:DUF6307 family protein [Mycolicibacterium flavescens]MCV7278346.1 hypothetical protein [Mycolicibacterium flavescens]